MVRVALRRSQDMARPAPPDMELGSPAIFAWNNQNVVRAGAAYDLNSQWTLRTGFSRGNRPFDSDAVANNFLTAISNSKSLSVGATWKLADKEEISAAFEHGIAVN